MCVIAISKTRKLEWDETQAMDAANPDGIGIAWVNPRDKLVEYAKGLDAVTAQSFIDRLPLPQVVHFRWASVGGKSPMLGHPFPLIEAPPLGLVGAAPSVLFHNGTWGQWEKGLDALRKAGEYVDPTEPWSDTRVMAALAVKHSPQAVAQIVGPAQRLATLSGDGRIWTAGQFYKHDGLLVSNLWWVPRPTVFDGDDRTDEDWEEVEEAERDVPTVPILHPAPKKRGRQARVIARVKAEKKAAKRSRQNAKLTQAVLFPTAMVSRYFPKVPRPTSPSRRRG